jgi:thiol-disulfide isomerase/thioredoxin
MVAFSRTAARMVLLSLVIIALAQGKMVLIEEFTASWCGPCASGDPAFQKLVRNNTGVVAVIAYHDSRSDKMYCKDAEDREVIYPQCRYYPCGVINGQNPPAGVGQTYPNFLPYIDQAAIDSMKKKEEWFSWKISSQRTGGTLPMQCSIVIEATALKNISDTLNKLFVAVVEEEVDHQAAYGVASPNGLNIHSHVFRKLLPTPGGKSIGILTIGDKTTLNTSYTCGTDVVYDKVRLIAFIQNMKTSEVVSTYATTVHPFTATIALYPAQKTVRNEGSMQLVIDKKQTGIFINGARTVRLFDCSGKVWEFSITQSGALALHGNYHRLPSGLYLIHGIAHDGSSVTVPFMKR